MKKILTLFCALLGFGAMASADPSVDSNGVFDLSVAGNDGNASYYSYDRGTETCTFTFPYWVTTNNEGNDATHYASSTGANNVDVNKADATEAGMTAITETYEAAEGDVYYKAALAWDCAGWGWWTAAYDVTTAGYNTITAVVNTDQQVKIVAQGSNWENAASDVKNVATAGTAEDVTLVVDLTTSKDVMSTGLVQLYFQNSVVGQIITVKSITFSREDTNEPEGSTNKTWRFDDTETFAGLRNYVDNSEALTDDNLSGGNYDGLTITIGSSTSCKYQSNSGAVMIGTQDGTDYPMVVTFANRLQMGQGSAGTKACIGVPVEDACTVYVVAASSSNADDRTIQVAEGTTEKTTLTAIKSSSQETTNCLLSYAYDGESNAEIIYFYSTSGSINFFCVAVSYDGSAPEFEDAVVVKPASEEIEGYLTVTVDGTDVTTNEAVKITVTEGEESEMTVAIDELEISNSITLSDVAVVFTPEANGEYTDGVVNGTVTVLYSSSNLSGVTATGTYVVEDGVTIFTASFKYTVLSQELVIAVSFTTVEPVAEPEYGWTLITDEFDATQLDGNNQIIIPMTTIKQYEQICIVTTVDISKSYGNYGAILTDGTWNSKFGGDNFTCEDAEETVTLVLNVEDLVGAITIDNLVYVVWDNVSAVAIYGYGEINEDTESNTEGGDNQEGVVSLPKAGDSFIDRFANQTGIWGGDDYTSEVVNGQVTWTTAGNWSGIGAWFNSGVDEDVAGLSIKMIAGGTGKVKAYVQWTDGVVEGSNVEVEATSATEEITLTIAFDKTSADKYENSDFRQVCVQFEGVTTSEAIFTEAVLLDESETAISDLKADIEAVEVARYNLMGQKISGAERGINIIVYSDGSAKKVLVK